MIETRTRILSSNQPFEAHAESIRAMLFGVLVSLVKDSVKDYFSDLYHDAWWIRENVDGPITFYYGVRALGTGTNIGHDLGLTSQGASSIYEIQLAVDKRGSWSIWSVITRSPSDA